VPFDLERAPFHISDPVAPSFPEEDRDHDNEDPCAEYDEDLEDFPSLYELADDPRDAEDHLGPGAPLQVPTEPCEDDPDPFVVEDDGSRSPSDTQHHPAHLVLLYAMVSWLHLQFSVPRVACNALLAFFACLFRSLRPDLVSPFITLQSATRALGVDPYIHLLPICPRCRDVFPSAASKHVQDRCTQCNEDLFLPDETRRGNQRATRTPIIKCPYLPLSDQIRSILRVPGIEALLDEWRKKPRTPGKYADIFDGRMCRDKLKGADSKPFFSNLPDEGTGPCGELRIGVNIGIDWYVPQAPCFRMTNSSSRFSYIRSNIAPSHSSCPISFSICNLPPEYRYVLLLHNSCSVADVLGIVRQT
jgi:hypothetical protein